MNIQVECPACASGFVVEASAAGTQFVCPSCSVPIVVPSGDAMPPEPPAPEPPPATVSGAVHDGAVEAESEADAEHEADEAGDGEVVCPRCQLHFSVERHAALEKPAGERKRVLIVEDMGYFRKIAEEALSDEYDVETAATVHDAQSVLAEYNVDLIVLDLSLNSRNDGLGLLRESMFKPCPVLIFTARDESEMYGEEWDELQRLGADDILIKGMNVAESLQRKVGALLGESPEG